MWLKQIQLFQLNHLVKFSLNDLKEKMEQLVFTPCLPSMPQSSGWVSPIDEDSMPLVRSINDNIMLCLQVEEKILPATVIRQELAEVIKQIENSENRKLRPKEKYALKDEITISLLPRAFSKLTKIYAYIDVKNHWLILGTANTKKSEQFISMFKKLITEDVYVQPLETKNLSSIMTYWLKTQNYPSSFAIEKACVLQDPNQENRVIRCKQQDLFATGIQSLLNDGCEAIQLALSWQDRVNFILSNDLSLSSIQFQDEIIAQVKEMEPETKQQQFDADFLIMTGTFSQMLPELKDALTNKREKSPQQASIIEFNNKLKQAQS